MNSGDVLYVISTDSGSVKDFDAFCKQTGNELLESTEAEGKYHYYIRKAWTIISPVVIATEQTRVVDRNISGLA